VLLHTKKPFHQIDNHSVFYSTGARSSVPDEQHWLSRQEIYVLSGFKLPKRRQDWLLGRWTAKSTLNLLAQPHSYRLQDWRITAAPDGAPGVWLNGKPVDLCISLSHSAGMAFCAVAASSQRMGCDIEKIEVRSRSFEETFFTASELELLERYPADERARLVTLVWSAKESVLKALRTGLRSDTRRIRIVSIETGDACRWRPFKAQDSRNGDTFDGWWQVKNSMLYTVASDDCTGEPVGL
jgi:4'-phosphopantetheinyl transferase